MLGPLPPMLPMALLERPLDYLLAEHHRHRSYLAELRQAAMSGSIPSDKAKRIFDFLAFELPLHWADEKVNLFPSLRRSALPEDGLDEVLGRLNTEHAQDAVLVGTIIAALAAGLAERRAHVPLAPATCEAMLGYAAAEAHHLAIENAVVLAIAGVRLRKPDLNALSLAMKARREASHVLHT